MEDLSNKTLSVFLLAVMVVSLFGTLMVLNKVSTGHGPTGFAPTAGGTVNLSVSSLISITTNESALVNFGSCTLNESRPINLTSMDDQDTPTYCTGFSRGNISVRNDGNVVVNVSLASDACAPRGGNTSCTFLNNSALPYTLNGLFQFNTSNAGLLTWSGGCATPVTWTTINTTTTGYRACSNLAATSPANSFVTNFLLSVPNGLGIGVKTATLTFTASIP
jgi:hypothetical protein